MGLRLSVCVVVVLMASAAQLSCRRSDPPEKTRCDPRRVVAEEVVHAQLTMTAPVGKIHKLLKPRITHSLRMLARLDLVYPTEQRLELRGCAEALGYKADIESDGTASLFIAIGSPGMFVDRRPLVTVVALDQARTATVRIKGYCRECTYPSSEVQMRLSEPSLVEFLRQVAREQKNRSVGRDRHDP